MALIKKYISEINCQLFENEYATVPSHPTETLSQEQHTNLENLKRTMNSEKTTLPSLRNKERRTLKTEAKKINQILHYISTNNIIELNELIYTWVKLECEKIFVPSKNMKKQSKPRWEIRLETQIKEIYENRPNGKTKRSWNMWEQNTKDNTRKNNNATWGNKTGNFWRKKGDQRDIDKR